MDAYVLRGSKYLVLGFVNGELRSMQTCLSDHGVSAIKMQHRRIYSHIEASYCKVITIDDVIALANGESKDLSDKDAEVLKSMGIAL